MQCQNDTAHNVNCIDGCSHDCRYCYARAAAVRVKRRTVADWHEMRPRAHEIDKRRRKLDGRVMFPTTHDITPETFGSCAKVLGELLRAGNEVLVVTKPPVRMTRNCAQNVTRCAQKVTQVPRSWHVTAARCGPLPAPEPAPEQDEDYAPHPWHPALLTVRYVVYEDRGVELVGPIQALETRTPPPPLRVPLPSIYLPPPIGMDSQKSTIDRV